LSRGGADDFRSLLKFFTEIVIEKVGMGESIGVGLGVEVII
jgi:hypothetical protein